MAQGQFNILTINAGSSSIKFSLHEWGVDPKVSLHGKIEKIGTSQPVLRYASLQQQPMLLYVTLKNIQEAAAFLTDWLEKQNGFTNIDAIGHRIVHGMNHPGAALINNGLLEELKHLSQYDPDHMPGAIVFIEQFRKLHPHLKQVACFDTAFHAVLPRVATMLPLPRRFEQQGLRRYGFHGLSYSYLLQQLEIMAGRKVARGKIILAHLGSGASMAAVKEGKDMDTTMGFTPAGGFMMGTRPGDLDPGITGYLLRTEQLTLEQMDKLINHESGLLGVSGISSDMQELLEKEAAEPRAAEAVALFCYQAKKHLCALTGVLEGLDSIVFSGGMGENAPRVRSKICSGLQYLGIALDEEKNQRNATVVSGADSRVSIYAIPTDEEYMIAKLTAALLNHPDNLSLT